MDKFDDAAEVNSRKKPARAASAFEATVRAQFQNREN